MEKEKFRARTSDIIAQMTWGCFSIFNYKLLINYIGKGSIGYSDIILISWLEESFANVFLKVYLWLDITKNVAFNRMWMAKLQSSTSVRLLYQPLSHFISTDVCSFK